MALRASSVYGGAGLLRSNWISRITRQWISNSRSRMESGLLNAFHDDHFDGNYSKYDNNLDLWSDGNDAMGLQLTETLHGILPITAAEEDPHYFEADLEQRLPYRFHTENDLTETMYNMDQDGGGDYILTNYSSIDAMSESMSPSIEIISVDPNCDFSSPVTVDDDSDTESDRSSSRSSHYSNNSDSSSIGDYESHSSEEDDEPPKQTVATKSEQNDNFLSTPTIQNKSTVKKCNQQPYIPKKAQIHQQQSANNIVTSFENIEFSIDEMNVPLVNRQSLSVSKNGSFSRKPLETEIDVKDFDLATFITQDNFDFLESALPERILVNKKSFAVSTLPISLEDIKIEEDSLSKDDSDTEAIIDIETVHDNDDKPMLLRKQTIEYNPVVDLNESFTQVDDDTKRDPSWSPNNFKSTKLQKTKTMRQTKTKKTNNLITQCNRIFNNNHTATSSNSVNKPNAVINRRKYGIGKGKNISMCTKPELYDSLSDADSCDDTAENNCKINANKKTGAIDSNNENSIKNNSTNSNIKPIVHRLEADTAVINPKVEVKIEKPIEVKYEHEDLNVDLDNGLNGDLAEKQAIENINSEMSVVVPIKKKLNLEEYKRRRENQLIGDTKIKKSIENNPTPVVQLKDEDSKKSQILQTANCPVQNCQSNSLLLKNHPAMKSRSDKGFVDPILEAKNKVLRMQELKKVARSKLIDSTVSAKVGPITPILPLEQICNGSFKSQDKSAMKLNAEYVEIIIVSASCNTDITLPPVFEKLDRNSAGNSKGGPITTIMKSSSLLSNINDTIKKANAAKISSNSLLSSIQDVVLKKSTTTLLNGAQLSQKSPNIGVSPPSQFSPQKPEMSQTDQLNVTAAGGSIPAENSNGNKEVEHGEDKIIMHLRKDRIRKKTASISIQTDELPQFPPITLLLADKYSNSQSENTKKRKRHDRHYRSRRRSTSASTDDEEYRSRSHVRYRSISSQGTNRSVSPRSSRYSSERNSRSYSNSRRTVSPYRKIRRRSSRSSSQTKSRASSSSTTGSETGRRARSRHRRNRRYSTSHSSSSSSSRSRSRSRSTRSKSRSRSRSRYSGNFGPHSNNRRQTSPAVEERRIVYVGRIERETSKEDLKRKFSSYGPIKQITLHYKDTGMKYGFVTFERAQDAYEAIERGMGDSKINMYDISFGGRRAFCRASYSDLDGAATNSLQVLPYPTAPRIIPVADDSFEALLQKVKEKMSSTKSSTASSRVKT